MADMRSKGRNVVPPHAGELNGMARLTEHDVIHIRLAYAEGTVDHKTLAATYGITRTNVSMITSGQNWKHVGGPITNGAKLRHRHRHL
jgi:hypothetical protein